MIVYVETNFILEIAFRQEEHASCVETLTLADEGKISLVIPSYCFGECLEKLTRQKRDRNTVANRLNVELIQIARAEEYRERARELTDAVGLLRESGLAATTRYEEVRQQLLKVGEAIPLDSEILQNAAKLESSEAEVSIESPQDAIVMASVMSHLDAERGKSCFLNRNRKDFNGPDVIASLATQDCKIMFNFEHGVDYIRSELS